MDKRISGVILSGGQCRRMGKDKAFCSFRGQEMIRHVIGLMKQYCDDIKISSNHAGYEALSYPVISDIHKGIGPLGGIHAALTHAKFDPVIVMACDMPLAHHSIVQALLENRKGHDVVVPVHNGYTEPLLALYHASATKQIEHHIEQGKYKLMDLLTALNTRYLDVSAIVAGLDFDPFTNINSQSDLDEQNSQGE